MDRVTVGRLRLDLRNQLGWECVAPIEDVGLVLQHLLGLGLRVGGQLEHDRVVIRRGDTREILGEIRALGLLMLNDLAKMKLAAKEVY